MANGNDLACCECQVLVYCREAVKGWESARKILASYYYSPGRQGRGVIRHVEGKAFRCEHCGYETDPVSKFSPTWAPTRCRRCRLKNCMFMIEGTVYYIAHPARGSRNVFADPYRVTNFVKAFYKLAELVIGPRGERIVGLWAIGYVQREIATRMHMSQSDVHRALDKLRRKYVTFRSEV